MTIYTTFFSEKTLITIFKTIPLPPDIQKHILELLISKLIQDDAWWYNFIHSEFWWYAHPQNSEKISDWYDIDTSDH